MPETYEPDDLGTTTPSEVKKYKPPKAQKPTPPIVTTPAENLAERTMFAASRTRDIWEKTPVSEIAMYQIPDSIYQSAVVQLDPVVAAGLNDWTIHLASTYGGENMGAVTATELIEDPVAQARTQDFISTMLDVVYPYTPGASLAQAYSDDELVQMILARNAAMLQGLGAVDLARAKTLGSELAANLESLPDVGMTGDMKRAAYISATGDVSVAISQEDQRTLLEEWPKALASIERGGATMDTGSPWAEQIAGALGLPTDEGLASVGIEQVRNIGEGGVFVLNSEDAKRDPLRTFALIELMKQKFPDAQVQYDRQGALASFLDMVARPIDYITAPFAALMTQTAEMSEQRERTDADRARMLEQADEVETIIGKGDQDAFVAFMSENGSHVGTGPLMFDEGYYQPDPRLENGEWVDMAMREVVALREEGTLEVGMDDFTAQMERNTKPLIAGFGFADSMMRAQDLMPGDPGYGPAYMITGLVGALMLDPLNWGPAVIGGIRAARLIPKFKRVMQSDEVVAALLQVKNGSLTDAAALSAARRANALGNTQDIGQGVVKNAAYNALGRYAEDFVATKPAMNTYKAIWTVKKKLLEAGLDEDDLATILRQVFAANKQLGGDVLVAKHLAGATSLEDQAIYMMGSMTGLNADLPDLNRIRAELNAITRNLDEAGASLTGSERVDLLARQAELNDILTGRDFVQPLHQVFTSKDIYRLERLTNQKLDRPRQVMAAATAMNEAIPAEILAAGGKTLQAYLKAQPSIERLAMNFWQRFARAFKPSGTGQLLRFPHTDPHARALRAKAMGSVDDVTKRLLAENELLTPADAKKAAQRMVAEAQPMADDVERSFDDLMNFGRRMGMTEVRMTELMKPWVAGDITDSPVAAFDWFVETWGKMVDESPRLNTIGKEHFAKMWDSLINDRSPGLVERKLPNGQVVWDPTISWPKVDPTTGTPIPHPVPGFTSDMFQIFRLPSEESLVTYFSQVKRTMLEFSNSGKIGRQFISNRHAGLVQLWSAWNSFWRTTTLGFRLGGALPLRILGEEMLRMPAAADAASLVSHPIEWFASTALGKRLFSDTDMALMGDSPEDALGVVVNAYNSNRSLKLLHAGRNEVFIGEPGFYRAITGRMQKVAAAPETRQFYLPHMGSPETALADMQQSVSGRYLIGLFEETHAKGGATAVEQVAALQTEIAQYIGTGPDAEFIRIAIARGGVKMPDGTEVTVGSHEFSELLERLAARGSWIPGTSKAKASAGVYLPPERTHSWSNMRDWLFRKGYTAPDLALARSPLWTQLATRRYRNLIRLGYAPDRARELARAHAARGVADIMFTIGAKTPGEFFLKNISPFFPAYRELAATWLLRVPKRVGEGSRVLGAAALARRADMWLDFFKGMGVVKTDEHGEDYTDLPWIDGLFKLVGLDNMRSTTLLGSAAGILPDFSNIGAVDENGNRLSWDEQIKGAGPTVGGPMAFLLGMANDVSDGKLDVLVNAFTLMGTDVSLGPTVVDRGLEAFGLYGPWMTGTTRDMHEHQKTWSIADGMNYSLNKHPYPVIADFDKDGDGDFLPQEQVEMRSAIMKWQEELVRDGESYSRIVYIAKTIFAGLLPFSVQVESEDKAKFSQMWSFLNVLPEEAGGGSLRSPYVEALLAANPGLETLMIGKNLDTRRVDTPNDTIDDYMNAVKDGAVVPRSAEDRAIFMLGMNSYSIYQSHLNAIYEAAGDTPAEIVVNFDAKEAIQREREQWNDFVDLSETVENWMPGQTQSFADMFNAYQGYQRLRSGENPRLSLEQEQLLEHDGNMDEYAKFFGPNPESSDEYYKLRDAAFEVLNGGLPTTPLGMANAWFFGDVSDTYYTRRSELFDKLDSSEERDKPAIFENIRNLADKYNKPWVNSEHPEWGEFPSPEEYVFIQLDEIDQKRQVVKWAELPPEFLTDFQREQVGYEVPEGKIKLKKQQVEAFEKAGINPDGVKTYADAANALSSLVNYWDLRFDKAVSKQGVTYSSTAVKESRAYFDTWFVDTAKKLGLEEYWQQAHDAPYKRVDRALGLSEKVPTWGRAVALADRLRGVVERQDFSVGGGGQVDLAQRKKMVEAVRRWRENDGVFDALMGELGVALEISGEDDLVVTLFFEAFSSANDYYLDVKKEKK